MLVCVVHALVDGCCCCLLIGAWCLVLFLVVVGCRCLCSCAVLVVRGLLFVDCCALLCVVSVRGSVCVLIAVE